VTREELAVLVLAHEDSFVERKTTPHRTDVVETLVAFANTHHDREAVLFLGVQPDGTPVGVKDPEKVQQSVAEWAMHQCFPPVRHQCVILNGLAADPVVAVLVPTSDERPHFTGHAFVRAGSRTEKASGRLLDELIASRNTKAGAILRCKGRTVTLHSPFPMRDLGRGESPRGAGHIYECTVEGCSAHSVELYHAGSGRLLSWPLERLDITADPEHRRCLRLIVRV
jgi:hypothetical protein